MRVGECGSLTHATRRSRERKGVEAIFSSQRAGGERNLLAGAASVVVGLVLTVFALFRTDAPRILGPLGSSLYSSLTFGALGALFLVCGGGTLTFFVACRKSRLPKDAVLRIDGPSEVDDFVDASGRTQRMFHSSPRIGALAFVQSLALVALYSGFVQEFESNKSMQIWVRSNFSVGQSVLNWEGVLLLSVSLAVLLLQFLPGRFFSEF